MNSHLGRFLVTPEFMSEMMDFVLFTSKKSFWYHIWRKSWKKKWKNSDFMEILSEFIIMLHCLSTSGSSLGTCLSQCTTFSPNWVTLTSLNLTSSLALQVSSCKPEWLWSIANLKLLLTWNRPTSSSIIRFFKKCIWVCTITAATVFALPQSTTWDMIHNGWIQLDPIKYFSQWEKELFNRCASSTLNCIMLGLCVGIMLQSTARWKAIFR